MNRYVSALRRLSNRGFAGGAGSFAGKAYRLLQRRGLRGFLEIFRHQVAEESLPPRPPNRPDDLDDYAFAVPFDFPVASPAGLRACAIIHVFYPELCSEILACLENIPVRVDAFISTTSEEKRRDIETAFAVYRNGAVEVRLFENRGRDIAPKLVGFGDVYSRYDVALSLHTKKSPHGGDHLAPWRQYLYGTLTGSPEIVGSILHLLMLGPVGFVFPQHFYPLRRHIHWGKNFDLAHDLLKLANVEIDKDMELECPSGSMFWCRTDALKALLDLHLEFADFPPEAGQVDGTLAHAIERAFLYACEARGYRWAKVVMPGSYPLPSTIIRALNPAAVLDGLGKVWRPLLKQGDSKANERSSLVPAPDRQEGSSSIEEKQRQF
jgi:lipopolysaccharide biosynthesis protein